MWSAIRSDLMDFVSTIAEDTSKSINKVIGEPEEDEEISAREQMITDLKRSYNTYGTPIEEQHLAQYDKFLKKFSLSSQAADIAELLDAEIDVSRYYAELVPSKVRPEDFWARYFFRMLLLSKEGAINLDDEDDEELLWETHENEKGDKEDTKTPGLSPISRKDVPDGEEGKSKPLRDKIALLETENTRLKGQVKTLAGRVTELEKELLQKVQSPSNCEPLLSTDTVKPTHSDQSKSEVKPAAQPTPNISRRAATSAVVEISSIDNVAPAAERSTRRTVALEPLSVPVSSSTSTFAAGEGGSSSFKPIPASGSTITTQVGTRLSAVSTSGTTLATESSINTGSVSPLTEVTEAFIRRAQRASQSANTNTLTNINSSANVSICTSEQEQSTLYLNNNDLYSETASEDSGVLVVPEKVTVAVPTSARKEAGEAGGMEMSSMNLISSFDNAVSDPPTLPAAVIVEKSVKEDTVKSPAKPIKAAVELAALDGDEEEDDGWS